MTPVFIIAPPRSRGTLLMRMLGRTPGITMSGEGDEFLVKLRQMQQFRRSHIKKHQEDSWPRFRLESREGDWSPMLKVWVSPAEADTHYGMRLTFLGREHWDKAVDWWSWLLETWPDARLIFLTRDLNEIEFSMEVTHHLRWVPLYGQCGGCCANRIRDLVGSMEDFNLMNPMRTLVMDSSDLADYNKTAEQLARVGIPLCREGWSREIGVISGAAKQLDLEYRSKFPLVTDPDDPFAPPTAEELAAHARASEDGRDPFAPFDPAIDVALPPVREDVTWDDVHPDVPLEQEDSGFLLPVPTEPAAAGKIEVHTLRYGDPDWMEHCAPTLDDWCSRHGYELKIHGPPVDMPDEKFGTIEMIRQFLAGDSDVMVFVDADVRIHPLAPPWQYREGFATRVEWYKRTLSKWHNWRRRNGHPLRRWAYRNTGVWSIDRKSAGTFLKVLGPVSAWTFGYREQHQFNIWMIAATSRGMRIVDMAPEWNVLAQLESRPGWFFHLNGRHKVKP